jgi:glycosyltransferase involved in cell wall biosynthesis
MATIDFVDDEVQGLVSVVIPVYRGEKYIADTLATLSAQTYSEWELIVVEDASHDATESIVAEFARRHPDRRVWFGRNERNSGPSHSRNVAFGQARGQFVALLDADDRWLPDHLSVSLAALASTGSDVSYSSVVMFEDETEILLGIWGPNEHDLRAFPHRLFLYNSITPSATVLRRQVLADVGPWNVELRYCEDLEFWLRCIDAGKTFQFIGGCHCLYRKNHAEAATNKRCALQEAFAEVVARFVNLRGAREKTCRRFAAKAYLSAADYHLQADPRKDRSADPRRAAALVEKAWKLKPRRVDYWLLTVKYRVTSRFRRVPQQAATDDASLRRAA